MLLENGIVRIGAEIEVAAWKRNKSYANPISALLEAGYMEGKPANWITWHQYNCTCEFGCARVKSGDILLPNPIVSVQYDASLPELGAEFIVSPVLLIDGMDEMQQIWEIICKDAFWTDKKKAMRGQILASPSIHLHVSAVKPGYMPQRNGMNDTIRTGTLVDDTLHCLSLFGVELIALSDVTNQRRGLTFRQPWRNADGRGRHHGFIHVRQMIAGKIAYIEWRMFEAAYNDWNYFETAAYLSAALTRALLRPDTIPALMEAGYHNPINAKDLEFAIIDNNTEAALALVSTRRLNTLYTIIENELHDDVRGQRKIAARFEEVLARVQ